MATNTQKSEECSWINAEGQLVSGSLQAHSEFMAWERENPSAVIEKIEAKIAVAQSTAPAAIVARVAEMSETQLHGLSRAVAARAAQIRLEPKQPKGSRPKSAFIGETGLGRACQANANFKVSASAPKRSIPAHLTGIARAIAANKARK